MSDSVKELRVSISRYIQLHLALGVVLTVFCATVAGLNAVYDGLDPFTWIYKYFSRVLVVSWSLVVIVVVFDIVSGWRHPIWQITQSGVSIRWTKHSEPRLFARREIASLRVYPLGIIVMTTTSKPFHVTMMVAASSDSSRWLRDFAKRQLAKSTA